MSMIGLTGRTFELIPEGETVLRIRSVDDSKVDTFGKLEIVYENAQGRRVWETYDFNGEKGDYAKWRFSCLYRAAMNLDEDVMGEVNPMDMVGHYIRTSIIHNQSKQPNDKGEYRTFVNLSNDKEHATGFDGKITPAAAPAPAEPKPAETVASDDTDFDLDDLLG